MITKAINCVFALACLIMIVSGSMFVQQQYAIRRVNLAVAKVKPGNYMKIDGALGRDTLLLELSSSCPHCVANQELYQELEGLPRVRDGRVQVVTAMLTDQRSHGEAFVRRNRIPGKVLLRVGTEKFPFTFLGTPSILLLNPQGRIVKMWTGELHGDREAEFLAQLN